MSWFSLALCSVLLSQISPVIPNTVCLTFQKCGFLFFVFPWPAFLDWVLLFLGRKEKEFQNAWATFLWPAHFLGPPYKWAAPHAHLRPPQSSVEQAAGRASPRLSLVALQAEARLITWTSPLRRRHLQRWNLGSLVKPETVFMPT